MNFLETLFGSPGKQGSTYNQNQLGSIDQIIQQINGMRSKGGGDISQQQNFQQGQGFLNNLFNDQDFFNNMEAPAMRQFHEEIMPNLANQFAGMGSGGSFGTAFRNQANREGSNLAERLSANRTGMQQQGANQALGYGQAQNQNFMQLLQQALQPTQNTYSQPTGGLLGPLMGALGGGAAAGYGQKLGQSMFGGGQSGNQDYANGGGNQYPMTDYYNQQFRQQGVF